MAMSEQSGDEHVKALIERLKALIEPHPVAHRRRESARDEARQRGRLLIVEREKSLPADVPLHKRGFGVMEEDGAA
jgi:hypothetical protein